ncbi:uncharacterized protein [Clytia hemisphaerica]|uniref:uncharacterized protein n=1 Tax=Clytia hemisphaerica TaxID=252671 RepID=UPI0034D465BE
MYLPIIIQMVTFWMSVGGNNEEILPQGELYNQQRNIKHYKRFDETVGSNNEEILPQGELYNQQRNIKHYKIFDETVGSNNEEILPQGELYNQQRNIKHYKRFDGTVGNNNGGIHRQDGGQQSSIKRYKRFDEKTGMDSYKEAKEAHQQKTLKSSLDKLKNQALDPFPITWNYTDKYSNRTFGVTRNSIALKSQPTECVYAVNKVRRLHGLPELSWATDIAYTAQEWALALAQIDKGCEATHDDYPNLWFNGKEIRLGENIFLSDDKFFDDCAQSIAAWYNEQFKGTHYNYDKPVYNVDPNGHGHFITLMWPTTKYFGVGISYDYDIECTYTVARFDGVPNENDFYKSRYRIPKPKEKVTVTEAYLTPKKQPPPVVYFLYIPSEGGWTEWIDVSTCSTTCGKGFKVQRRFCITPESLNGHPPNCGADKERMQIIMCERQVVCPGDNDERKKDGICEDKTPNFCKRKVTPGNGRKECRQKDTKEQMTRDCKKTCRFCEPCMNYHRDCPGYASVSYGYCTDDKYSAWMEWKCARSCGYCNQNQTKPMGDDCYDLSDKCSDYADHFDDDYCNHPKYAKWMSQACKESCLYCKDCTDKSPYCETLKKNGLCVAKNRQVYSWMVMECSKSCGYCFEKSVFQKDITKVAGQRP